AERLQVQLQMLQGGGANGNRTAAREAWNNAQTFWNNYGHRNKLVAGHFLENVKAVAEQAKRVPQLAAATLEYYTWMQREEALVKMRQAGALAQRGQWQSAQTILQDLVNELTKLQADLQTSNDLSELRSALVDPAPQAQREAIRKIYDETTGDLGPSGSLFWVRYSALLRLEQLKRKPS